MTKLSAKHEFEIRHYVWAISEIENEIIGYFPILKTCKGGQTLKLYNFIQSLTPNEQRAFLRACILRSHPQAAVALGERATAEDEMLLKKYCNLLPPDRDIEIADRRRMGETVPLATKAKIQKTMTARFADSFGSDCAEIWPATKDRGPIFIMKTCGWNIQTSFWFGRRHGLIKFSHVVSSEETIQHPDNPNIVGPSMVLASMLCWANVANLEWAYLMNDELDSVCNTVASLCRRTFDAMPQFLKGLEYCNLV